MKLPVLAFPKVKSQPYRKIRKKIQSGDILLDSGTGMFSKMIMGATKSIWSHVAFILVTDTPSVDEFALADLNTDSQLNVLDVVILVDMILGG